MGKTTSPVLYVTPKKIEFPDLHTAERFDKMKKVSCPGGCGALVTERYLNIHLDKCLEERSPVYGRKKKKVVSETESDSEVEIGNSPVVKQTRVLRKRSNRPVIEESDEDPVGGGHHEDIRDEAAAMDLDDTPLSPNLLENAVDPTVSKETSGQVTGVEWSPSLPRSRDLFDISVVENTGQSTLDDTFDNSHMMELDDDIEELMEAALAVESSQMEKPRENPNDEKVSLPKRSKRAKVVKEDVKEDAGGRSPCFRSTRLRRRK